MPTASDLIEDYLRDNEQLSENSIISYKRNAGKYGQLNMDIATFKEMRKVAEQGATANSKATIINVAIMLTKNRPQIFNRLTQYRDELREQIASDRKKKMVSLNDDLPSYESLIEELNSQNGLNYVINYLLIHNALRNADLELYYSKSKSPDDNSKNYIYKNQKTGEIILIINKYKTAGTYGKKTIIINNKRLAEEVSKLELKDGDALFKLDGKPASSKTITQRIRRATVNKLSEGEVAKVVVKHWIDDKNFEELRRISRSRGTSMDTLLSSYNIYDDK
jgi:hypothetical protein